MRAPSKRSVCPAPLPRLTSALTRRLILLPLLALVATGIGYCWYCASHTMAENARVAQLPETAIQYGSFTLELEYEWLVVVAAATFYGAIGWRYLGGWLVLPQVLALLVLCGASLGAAFDCVGRTHYASAVPCGMQGGAVAGAILALGLAYFYRRVPRQPLTLRAMLGGMLAVAVVLGGLHAWLQWRYAERIQWQREQIRLYGR